MYKAILLVLIFISALMAEFTRSNDGVITDSDTKLQWQDAKIQKKVNWNQAMNYCDKLTLGGKNDWRLPSVDELNSIVNGSFIKHKMKYKPSHMYYWTSKVFDGDVDQAYEIDFEKGDIIHFYKKELLPFRCVRS